jgi:hypothetical protein
MSGTGTVITLESIMPAYGKYYLGFRELEGVTRAKGVPVKVTYGSQTCEKGGGETPGD